MTALRAIFAIALAAALFGPAPALADPLLRPSVNVDGDMVHLGDLFDNVGDKTDVAVARAPAPGRRVVVDGDWLQHAAAMNGLNWKSDDPFLEVVIARNGQAISRERIERELVAALASQGVPDDTQIEFSSRDPQLVVPVDVPASIAVEDLYYDADSKRFSAAIVSPAEGPGQQRLSLSGRVVETVDVPTLAHAVARGEVIGARDLAFIRVRKDSLHRDAVMDVDKIIGLTPRQPMRAGQMLAAADLQRPLAVAHGALVTMTLREGALTLTTQGRALEQGSVGDVIRVANTHSNQTVSARIEGPNMVSIGGVEGVALAN